MNITAYRAYMASTSNNYTDAYNGSKATSVGVVTTAANDAQDSVGTLVSTTIAKEASAGLLVASLNVALDSVGTLDSTSKIKNDSVGLLVGSLNAALDSVGTKVGSAAIATDLSTLLASVWTQLQAIETHLPD